MENVKQSKRYYRGAFALLAAGILSKVISAFYRIPLQNLTGDIGFYIYQQVYPILGIAFMFALYGFPSAISKYLSETPPHLHNKRTYIRIFMVMTGFSLCIFILLFCFSPLLSHWMRDSLLTEPLRHVAWVFLFIPFVALLRGVSQSSQQMEPTAYSQMVEQILRAVIIIVCAVYIYKGYENAYFIAEGAVIASIAALSASFLFLYVYSRKHIKWELTDNIQEINLWKLGRSIILYGFVISMNHMFLLLMQLADAFTIVPGLLKSGTTLTEAAKIKGIFDRGQPLLQLVTIVGSSFALALVPQVTKISWQISRKDTLKKIRLTLKYCVLLSVGATAGLVTLYPEINQLFFQNLDGTDSLRLLSVSLLFTSLAVTIASILQGFGYMKWTAIVLFSGLWLKIILNYILIPYIGIYGGAIATVITTAFILAANLVVLRNIIKNNVIVKLPWGKLVLATLIMVGVLFIVKAILLPVNTRIGLLIMVSISVAIGFVVYAVVIIKMKILKGEELEPIPLPGKWKKG